MFFVPGYANWYVLPPRIVLAGQCQGTLIGIPNANWYTEADWYNFETPRWDTKTRRQGQDQDACDHTGSRMQRMDMSMSRLEKQYGLPQSGRLANKQNTKFLEPERYYEVIHTPGLWRHKTPPIQFTLVVDNFGVKYVGKEHADHLLRILWHHCSAVYIVA